MICTPWTESLPLWIDPASLTVFGLPPRDPNNDDDEEEEDEDEDEDEEEDLEPPLVREPEPDE
jgi:hypothetical protein